MSDLERAKLIPVSGNNDTPDMHNAIDVQFNPITLKVSLANTLKANASQGNSRATQFVDKSSSTLTVELMFDTTYIETATSNGQGGETAQGNNREQIEQGSDVREQTKKIADKFIKPVEAGSKMQAPSRVLFQWGSFEFVGMVQSYDETLDFFSPKGRPLRATVSLKLSEDRYQFRSNDSAARDANQTPTLSFTGNGASAAPSQDASPVPGNGSNNGVGSWRDNALFNGIESPRLPSLAALALPSVGLTSTGFGISIGISGGSGASLSGSVLPATGGSASKTSITGVKPAKGSAPTASNTTPPFKYGNSSALGTSIPGAFSANPSASLKASSLQQSSLQLRSKASHPGSGPNPAQTPGSPGTRAVPEPGVSQRSHHGLFVAALLKNAPDNGVGFD